MTTFKIAVTDEELMDGAYLMRPPNKLELWLGSLPTTGRVYSQYDIMTRTTTYRWKQDEVKAYEGHRFDDFA